MKFAWLCQFRRGEVVVVWENTERPYLPYGGPRQYGEFKITGRFAKLRAWLWAQMFVFPRPRAAVFLKDA